MSLTKATYSMINGAQVNVLDYGADPTGLNDSTEAIQAAVATGRDVFFPAGIYLSSQGIGIKSGQRLYGDGIPQRSNRTSAAVSRIKFTADVWGVNTATNNAIGYAIENLFLEHDGVFTSTKGAFKAGVKGSTDGTYQGLRGRLKNVIAYGNWSIGFGVYDWSWSTTFDECSADMFLEVGFDFARAGNVVTCTSCEAIQSIATGSGERIGWVIDECFAVTLVNCRIENNNKGLRAENGSTVQVVNPYVENNRTTDFTIRDPKTSLHISAAIALHTNDGVTTDAIFSAADTDYTSSLIVDGCYIKVSVGEVGHDNDLTQMYNGTAPCGTVLRNIQWDATGNLFKSSAGTSWAPNHLTLTNIPHVELKNRGSSSPHQMVAIGEDSTGTTPADSLFEFDDYDGTTQSVKYTNSRVWNNVTTGATAYRWYDGSTWNAVAR